VNYFTYYFTGCLIAKNNNIFDKIKNIIVKTPIYLIVLLYLLFGILGGMVYEGYIKAFEEIEDNAQGIIRITLKYVNKQKVITGLKRISKPGLRVYATKDELPKVLGGLGIALISTSKGIMTDKNARKEGIEGEVLAFVW
jgi:small subunit ribosomal protein S8